MANLCFITFVFIFLRLIYILSCSCSFYYSDSLWLRIGIYIVGFPYSPLLFWVILHSICFHFSLILLIVYCSRSSSLPPYINPALYKPKNKKKKQFWWLPFIVPIILIEFLVISSISFIFHSPSNNHLTDPDCSFMSEPIRFVHLSSGFLYFSTIKWIPSVRIDSFANPSAEHPFLLLECSWHLHHEHLPGPYLKLQLFKIPHYCFQCHSLNLSM